MKEELNDEKLPGGVEDAWATGFYQNHSIIRQKCGKKYATRKASTGTEIGISSLKRAADARDNVLVKKKIEILEIERKPLLYHTPKVNTKRSDAENKDVE